MRHRTHLLSRSLATLTIHSIRPHSNWKDQLLEPNSLCTLLRSCADAPALAEGRALHARAVTSGMSCIPAVSNHLINMYGKGGVLRDAHLVFDEMPIRNLFSWNNLIGCYCKAGLVGDARKLFDEMPSQDSVSWNTMISGYDKHGPCEEALALFGRMRRLGFKVDHFGVSSVVSACSSLRFVANGKEMHGLSIKVGLDLNVHVGSALVELYGKGIEIDGARRMFDAMVDREQFTWNSMLSGYIQCSRIDEAIAFLVEMPNKNLVSWTAIIVGCSQHDRNIEAIGFYYQMLDSGFSLDEVSVVSVLTACAGILDLDEGCKVHSFVVKNGFENNDFVGSVLVTFYAKCGKFYEANMVVEGMYTVDDFSWSVLIAEFAKHGYIESACYLFEGLDAKSLPLWNALITGYADVGLHEKAFEAFREMSSDGTRGDEFTFACLLKGSELFSLRYLKQLHSQIVKVGLYSSEYVASAFIDMYCSFVEYVAAEQVFHSVKNPNIVSWNALISGYACNNRIEALNIYKYLNTSSVRPDKITISSVVDVCSSLLLLACGMQVHSVAHKIGLESDVVVGSAFIDMYGKCEKVEHASVAFFEIHWPNVISWTSLLGAYVRCGMWDLATETFNVMPEKNLISWNTMLTGHARQGSGMEAFKLFRGMNNSGILPDRISFVSLLSVCCNLCLEEEGKQVHGQIIKTGYYLNFHVIASLSSMYQKLGMGEQTQHVVSRSLVCNLGIFQGTDVTYNVSQDL